MRERVTLLLEGVALVLGELGLLLEGEWLLCGVVVAEKALYFFQESPIRRIWPGVNSDLHLLA